MTSSFRGSDEILDREIETLETLAQRRLRRYARDLRELDRDLNDLRRERATRRRAAAPIVEVLPEESPAEGET